MRYSVACMVFFSLSVFLATIAAAAVDPVVDSERTNHANDGASPTPPPTPGEAPSVPSASDVPSLLGAIVSAASSENWRLLFSAVVMLAVFVINRFWVHSLPAAKRNIILPWASVGFACLIQFATIFRDGGTVLDALNGVFITGAGAAGLWSLVGKHMLKRFTVPVQSGEGLA